MLSALSGLLVVDKPQGITSQTLVNKVKRLLGASKAGHAGTLDPLATGVMLVGLDTGTRLLEYLVGLDKTYIATIKLGELRDTLDREGELIETRPVGDYSLQQIENAFKPFVGDISQKPPVYSAIKVGGVASYKKARKGIDTDLPPRAVTIHGIRVVSVELPFVVAEVSCGSGTYIRSLARDFGEALGTVASIWELRRTRVGPFVVEKSVTLEEIEKNIAAPEVLPLEEMLLGLKMITVDEREGGLLTHGVRVECPAELAGEVAVMDQNGLLLALCLAKDGVLSPRKVIARDKS